MTDLIARNLEVTRGYYRFSQRFRDYLGNEASWPTFAVWASAQAGSTIRKEDLLRQLERRLGDSPEVRRLVEGPFKLAGRFVLEAVLRLNPFEGSSQAVSRGNIKVYAEIGGEFARFLGLLESRPDAARIVAFTDSLLGGPPPDGQDHLKRSFTAYFQAMQETGKARSERILFANLSIGVHEQTRLQPEILAALDATLWDAVEAKERLFSLLLPHLAAVHRSLARSVLHRRLEPLLIPIVELTQRIVREIVTESMMVLELPGEVLRLGHDLSGGFPPSLRAIESPELLALIREVDLTADSLADTGADDWAVFPQRMHFIADLFRSRQDCLRLFESPLGDLASQG